MARTIGSSSLTRIVWIATAAVAIGVAIPYARYPFAGEHGLFSYGAWRILHGGVQYRDVWDQNPPGALAIHTIAELVFGHGMGAIRSFDLVWMGATLALLYAFSRSALGRLAAALGVLFVAMHYFTLGNQPTAQRDGFCLLPTFVAALAVGIARRNPRAETRAALVIGVATAAIFWIKPPLALAGGVCALALVGGAAARPRSFAAVAVGFLVPSGLVLAYFWANGALVDLYECVVRFNAIYVQERLSPADQLRSFGKIALRDPILIVGVVGLVLARGPAARLLAAIAAAFLFVVLLQGKHLGYHFVPLRVVLCAGAGYTVARLLQAQRWAVPARIAAAGIVLIAATSFAAAFQEQGFAQMWSTWLRNRGVDQLPREESRLAKLVASQTSSDETVLIWGVGPAATTGYLAERASPTRFMKSHPFSMPGPEPDLIRRWREEFMAGLHVDPPRIVVVVSGDAWPSLGNIDSRASFERFGELRDFVGQRYRKSTEMGGRLHYTIYRRMD